MSLIKRFERNTAGRDFAVGDIHGHFTRLQQALDAAGFDPARDRLFSVGDLVDRGPESEQVLAWLDKSWFHPVRGNHDDYVCRFDTCDMDNWLYNGGVWFQGLPVDERGLYQVMFRDLPLAIEVETEQGLIGIVHADCPFASWEELRAELVEMPGGRGRLKQIANTCMWSRGRVTDMDCSGIDGLRALVCGHSPVNSPLILGNVYHIDTAGWLPHMRGYFTLLDLATLQTIPPMPAKLDWEDA